MSLSKSASRFFTRRLLYGALLPLRGVNVRQEHRRQRKFDAMTIEARRSAQLERLKCIVAAASNSPLYRRLYQDSKLWTNGISSIADFLSLPILEKEKLRSAQRMSIGPHNSKYIATRRTSGTTGEAICIYLNEEALAAQLAARALFFENCGLRLGDREARLWGRRERRTSLKPRLKNFALNRKVFELSEVSKASDLEELFRYAPDYIYGYSSIVISLSRQLHELGTRLPHLKSVICTAENLYPEQKKMLEQVFQCPVHIEYGCSEMDLIASTCAQGTLHVNMERVYLETVKGPSGSEDAVVTDLSNTAYPLLRYRLGDALALEDKDCACGRQSQVITKIKGRTQNQYIRSPAGALEHSVVFAYMMDELSSTGIHIPQWRITQTSFESFLLEVATAQEETLTEVADFVSQRIKARYGSHISIAAKMTNAPIQTGEKHSYFIGLPESQTPHL